MAAFNYRAPRLDTSFASAIGDGFAQAGQTAINYDTQLKDNAFKKKKQIDDAAYRTDMLQTIKTQNIATNDFKTKTLAQKQGTLDNAIADRNSQVGAWANNYATNNPSDPRVIDYQENPSVFKQNGLGNYGMVNQEIKKNKDKPNYKSVNTKEGVYMYDTNTGKGFQTGQTSEKSQTSLMMDMLREQQIQNGKSQNNKRTFDEQRTSQQDMQKLGDRADINYGDTWKDIPIEQKKFALGHFQKNGVFPTLEGDGWFDGDPRLKGYQKPRLKAADLIQGL